MEKPVPRIPRWFQVYMYFVGIGGNLFFYIQAWEIYSTRSARDVSLAAFSVALWAVAGWLMYGLWLRNPVIIIANVVAVIGASLVVVGCLLHGHA